MSARHVLAWVLVVTLLVALGLLVRRGWLWAHKIAKLCNAAHATLFDLYPVLGGISSHLERLALGARACTVTVLCETGEGEMRVMGDTIELAPGAQGEVRLHLQNVVGRMVFMLHGPRDATISDCTVGQEHLFCAVPDRGVVFGYSRTPATPGQIVVFRLRRWPESSRGAA